MKKNIYTHREETLAAAAFINDNRATAYLWTNGNNTFYDVNGVIWSVWQDGTGNYPETEGDLSINEPVMKRENIATVVKSLFLENIMAWPEKYRYPSAGQINAIQTALSYWANRTEQEIERDTKAGVIKRDYINWCIEQFKSGSFVIN